MRSTLIPAPEYELARVNHLRSRARRGPGAPAGSPVTLPDPLTAMEICGAPLLRFDLLPGAWFPGPLLRVPTGQVWCFYGVGDVSHHDHLAGMRLRVNTPGKKGGVFTRIAEEWETNTLHLGNLQAALPQEFRQPRLGYFEPPVWIHGAATTTYWFEFLGSGNAEGAITLLGYAGTGLA